MKTITFLGAILLTVSTATTAAPTIYDLGSVAPNAVNLSRDAGVSVYRWSLGGGDFAYQVNTTSGLVLGAFIIGRNGSTNALKIGRQQLSFGGSTTNIQASTVVENNAPRCPCQTAMTYDDDYVRIYVTYAADGSVINVTVINKKQQTQ